MSHDIYHTNALCNVQWFYWVFFPSDRTKRKKRAHISAWYSFEDACIHTRHLSLRRIISFLTEVRWRCDSLSLSEFHGLLDMIIHYNTPFTRERDDDLPNEKILGGLHYGQKCFPKMKRKPIKQTFHMTPKQIHTKKRYWYLRPSEETYKWGRGQEWSFFKHWLIRDNFSLVPSENALSLGVVVCRLITSLVNTNLGKRTSIRLRRPTESILLQATYESARTIYKKLVVGSSRSPTNQPMRALTTTIRPHHLFKVVFSSPIRTINPRQSLWMIIFYRISNLDMEYWAGISSAASSYSPVV